MLSNLINIYFALFYITLFILKKFNTYQFNFHNINNININTQNHSLLKITFNISHSLQIILQLNNKIQLPQIRLNPLTLNILPHPPTQTLRTKLVILKLSKYQLIQIP